MVSELGNGKERLWRCWPPFDERFEQRTENPHEVEQKFGAEFEEIETLMGKGTEAQQI